MTPGLGDEGVPPDFRVLFERLPGAFLVLDPGLIIVAASDAYLAATSTVRHEIVGRGVFDVFPDNPDDPESESGRNMRASVSRVLDLGVTDAMPLARHDVRRPPPASGFEERYWSATNAPALDDEGALAYVIHQVVDVTELVKHRQRATPGVVPEAATAAQRVEAEIIGRRVEVAALHTELIETSSRLQQSEQTLREFLDFAPAVIFARDTEGRLVLANRQFESRFRREDDPEPSDGPSVHPLSAPVHEWGAALERQVIETGAPVSAETELSGPDGEPLTYVFTKFPLRTPAGAIYAVGTIATDVTDDRRARDDLRASEERFRQVAENVDEVFILWERGTAEVLYVSPTALRILGIDAEQCRDPAARLAIVHPDDRDDVAAPPAPLKEFRILGPNGDMRWIRSRTSMIETPPGQPDRGVTTFVDFTDQKVAELAAQSARTDAEMANRAKSDFLSRMSHELHTPLNAILGFAQVLELEELGAEQRDPVEQIIAAGTHLLGLIDEILDISRADLDDPMLPSASSAAAAPRGDRGSGTTVLYVEDNVSNVRLLERVLRSRPDIALLVAEVGGRALDLAVEHQPDLVLLDLHLPDMDGEDVLRGLRADPRTADIPVVVLSADATAGRSAQLRALGALDYLTKPFDVARLFEVIDRLGTARGLAPVDETRPAPVPVPVPKPASLDLLRFEHDLRNMLGAILNYGELLAESVTDATAVSDLEAISRAVARAIALTKELGDFARNA